MLPAAAVSVLPPAWADHEEVSPIGKKFYFIDWEGVIAVDNGGTVEKKVIRGTFRYVRTEKGWRHVGKSKRGHGIDDD